MSHDLRQMFGYKEPSHAQAKAIVALRTAFYDLGQKLVAETATGLPQARALAKLQEASWAALSAVVSENQGT